MSSTFDWVVIGGGSAGFNSARVAAGLGRRVAIIDGAPELGGLCILRGCMPSKTLLYATDVLHQARKGATFGLRIPSAAVDMPALQTWKKKVIAEFASYRAASMESGKYTLFRSQARFVDAHTLALADGRTVRGENILIATGSRVGVPPLPGLADVPTWTSDEVLDLDFVPRSVIVLGGGIVACELAQFLRRIGAEVTLVQRSAQILRDHSPAAAAVVAQALRDDGIELFTDTKIEHITRVGDRVAVTFAHAGQSVLRTADHLFNALGRVPQVEGLELAAAGVALAPSGRIQVNGWQQTTVPHIYAGGDVCGPYDVVHLAVAQGELAARHAFGVPGLRPLNPHHLLDVVFTDPPLATLGRREAELQATGQPYLAASYPFNDHGKSILMDALAGHVRVLADPADGRLLGAEIVGRDAGELIHILSTPLVMGATVHDLLKAPWYHPTLAEIITYPLEEIAEQLAASPRGA